MEKVPLVNEPIKYFADYQREWFKIVKPLKRDRYIVQSTSELSIHGDAPKCFLRIKEYQEGLWTDRQRKWPKYIAKVGSKWYPVESITEQLITRIGQVCGFNVADSKLRMVGSQVRFLSRFFLRRAESLTHGIEIFQEDFGKEMVQDIAAERLERDFYTFNVVVSSLQRAFPTESNQIVRDLVRMLVFDAIIGNNDRHPANWGVITSIKQSIPSRFSPIFDTARGMFWNMTEERIRNRLANPVELESYIDMSGPQIGWEGRVKLNHFQLISLIYVNFPQYQDSIRVATLLVNFDECAKMIEEEFSPLLSSERISLQFNVCVCERKNYARRLGWTRAETTVVTNVLGLETSLA